MPANPLEMFGAIRRKKSLVAPTSLPPAIEPIPADKKTVSRSPSGEWLFALFRFLMALPGPIFLVFTATQYFRRDSFSGWTGSFTELEAGKTLAYQVWYASTPMYFLSLLSAKIYDNDYAGGEKVNTMQVWIPLMALEAASYLWKKVNTIRVWTPLRALEAWKKVNTIRVWTPLRALEAASYLFSIWAYFMFYYRDHVGLRFDTYAFTFFFANGWFVVMIYMLTKVVRAIKVSQGREYKKFVLSQASRIGIQTILMACLTTYALPAMLRVPITAPLLPVFEDLSLHGIACADPAAFLSAFEASAANASCPALPYCGYATYEDLCQAVQYAPMVKVLQDDLNDVHILVFVSWAIISFFLFGTGRARADDGYKHLLSPHMLVAFLLGAVQLIATLFSFMRLFSVVIRLSVPRPAAYFDRTDMMTKYELPMTCYGECASFKVWSKYVLYGLIVIALNVDFLQQYVKNVLISEEARKLLVEQDMNNLRLSKHEQDGWEDDAPFFYFLPAKLVREWSAETLPRMQDLRDMGHLKKMKVPLKDAFREPAFRGVGIMANILFVSHRWEDKSKPDVEGVQLAAIKAHLKANPDIEWVWFDYSSMPQGDDRTVMEKAEFQLMLATITDLYLTARVLILLDGSYASRFWTLTEAWCSMQTATSDGLRPAKDEERRYTIKCIHTADEKHDVAGLVEKVSQKTPEEMFDHLKKPDVNVTNAKDKVAVLPVILKTNEHVVEMFQKLVILPEPKPAVAAAATLVLDIKPDELGNVISLGIELRTPSEKLPPPMQQ